MTDRDERFAAVVGLRRRTRRPAGARHRIGLSGLVVRLFALVAPRLHAAVLEEIFQESRQPGQIGLDPGQRGFDSGEPVAAAAAGSLTEVGDGLGLFDGEDAPERVRRRLEREREAPGPRSRPIR